MFVILGLLLLMLSVAVWGQLRSRQATDETERIVAKFEEAITTAVRWRGLSELAATMSMGSAATTDQELKKDFDARVAALTARISPIQEQVNRTAISEADKVALAYVAKTRTELRAFGPKVKELRSTGDMAAVQAFIDKEYKPMAIAYLDAIDKYVATQASSATGLRRSIRPLPIWTA